MDLLIPFLFNYQHSGKFIGRSLLCPDPRDEDGDGNCEDGHGSNAPLRAVAEVLGAEALPRGSTLAAAVFLGALGIGEAVSRHSSIQVDDHAEVLVAGASRGLSLLKSAAVLATRAAAGMANVALKSVAHGQN